MAAVYPSTSPYFTTPINSFGLGVMSNRSIPKNSSDTLFKITQTYEYRPDLLAFDLYGDHGLWWVFSARNPNTLQDPLGDFVIGVEIYLPNYSTLKGALGL